MSGGSPATSRLTAIFPSAANLNHIHEQQNSRGESRAYVGDLKTNRKLEVRGKSVRVDEFAASIPREKRANSGAATTASGSIRPPCACLR